MTTEIRQPDKEGVGGRAWRVETPDSPGACAVWVIHQPKVHVLWSWWMMSVVHLRPVAGLPPARISFAGATHEIHFAACNPEVPAPDPDDVSTIKTMQPLDLAKQVAEIDDKRAVEILEILVQTAVDGRLAVDVDYRRFWEDAIDQLIGKSK